LDVVPNSLTGETWFVFLPERIGELPEIQRRYPGGDLQIENWHDDLALYVAYKVEAP
jgi:hypothetical protein